MKRSSRTPHLIWFRIIAVSLVTSIATIGDAAIIGQYTLVRDPPGIPFTSPDAALGSPWVGYTIDIAATAGETIAAVDFSITGPLHQRWNYSVDSDDYAATANTPNLTNGDSHLRAPAGALFAAGPTEDNPGTGSPLTSTAAALYGVGTTLSGAWGIPVAARGSTASVAYIVVPRDAIPALSIRIRVANPQGDIIGDLREGCCVNGPAINVYGAGRIIGDGDVTPNLLDGTNFGEVDPLQAVQRTFTINNPGLSRLQLQPPTLTGPYSLVGGFPTSVQPRQSANFTVAFNSALAIGAYPGSIAFGHNAVSGGIYNFDLTTRVVPEPTAILVAGVALGAVAGCRRWR
jgi:hypothetical protein